MRQNTLRTARGTFWAGFSDSPAAMPISSVPWKEKPTIMATPISAAKPPANGASPAEKLAMLPHRPSGAPPVRMPKTISRPTPMKTSTVTTLMAANQNSDSPKPLDDSEFRPNISARKIALHSRPLTPGNQ